MHGTRVIAVIAALLLSSTTGWGQVINPANGHQYQLIDHSVNWYQANDSAQKLGGYLVTITSAEEQTFVESLIYPQGVFWIGATDSLSEGNWQWVTGEAWGYTNWFPGEPSNSMGIENFATVLTKFGFTGQWNDYGASGSAAFIIEWGAVALPVAQNVNFGPEAQGNKVYTPTPTVFWSYYDDPPSAQAAYEIEFGTDADWSVAELWAPGPITSADTSVTYAGAPLPYPGVFYLRVRVSDGTNWGDWARASFIYQAPSAVIYVPDDYLTIASALAAANAYDTVMVRAGVYSGNGFVDLTLPARPVTLTSESGAAATVIDAQGYDGFILKIDNGADSSTVISGLSFLNADSTAVILSGSSPIIDGCFFGGNVTTNKGAALSSYNATSPIIRNCTFDRNYSKWCGGALSFHHSGTPKIENCRFVANRAPYGGAAISVYTDATFSNCFFIRNVATGDGAASYSQNNGVHRFTNCTFDGNRGANSSIATINTQAGLYVDHSIITNSTGPSILVVSDVAHISCTDIFGNAGGDWTPSIITLQGVDGNFSQDPQYCDHTYLTLESGSPCAPTGNSCGVLIGAGAVGCSAAYPLAENVNFGANTEGNVTADPIPVVYWSYVDNPPSTQSAYEIQVGTDPDWTMAEMWTSGEVSSTDTSVTYGGSALNSGQTYYLRMRVSNGSTWGEWSSAAFKTHHLRVLHVPADYPTIADAFIAASDDDTILVAPGTYTGAGFINVIVPLKRLVLMSEGNNPAATVLDANYQSESIFRFVAAHDSLTVVKGFTFTKSHTNAVYIGMGSSALIENCIFSDNATTGKGGAISVYQANAPIIRGCVFDHNLSSWCGGALSFDGVASPKVINCKFDHNSAPYGGAVISVYADVTFTGCLFVGNSASGDGAASYNQNSGIHRFVNCTFFGNAGTQSTMSAIRVLTNAYLANCIIAGTSPGRAIHSSSAVAISCTDIWGNTDGDWTSDIQSQQAMNGNMSADPQFCDESFFSIPETSPCAPANNSCGVLIGSGPYGCSAVRVTSVRVDGVPSNTHVISATPVFDWLSTVSPQTAFEIAIGTDNDWLTAEMWSPAVFEVSDQSVTYAGATLVEGTGYYGRLRISNGTEWSAWYSFAFRINRTPSAPAKLGPANGEWTTLTPNLVVNGAVDDPGEVIFIDYQIFTDSTDVNPVASVTNHPGGEVVVWTVSPPLSDNTAFYWRARAWDGYAHSAWSAFSWFGANTTPDAPQAVTLIAPPTDAGKPIYTLLPTLSWNAAVDPDPFDSMTYKLELAVDANFQFKLQIDSIKATSLVLSDSLLNDMHYWWRVIARDKSGRTSQSAAKDFWTWESGDLDQNRNVDMADLSLLLNALYIDPRVPDNRVAADVNGDCSVDIDDVTWLIRHLFITYEPLRPGCQ